MTSPSKDDLARIVDHEHYWIDAPDDETLWHCPSCGRTECRHGVEASEICDECAALDEEKPHE